MMRMMLSILQRDKFTRSKRQNRGEQTLEASAHDLPSGLAIVPLPPTLLDYQDLVPEGILQALGSFVPIPVPIALRTRNQNAPKKNKNSVETSGSELLRLQKELAIAQTTIIERDTTVDERIVAMQMLSEEVKLWVTRCRQLVGVLQVVEMERDNFKAGEGHAKEMGAGFQVKLAQEDPGSRSSGLSELATELVDTKAELVDTKDRLVAAQAQADWHKVHCDHAYAQLDKHKRQLMFHTTFPPEADSYLALGIFSDQSLSHTNDLHTQLYIAIQTQDKYHREFVVQHYYQHKRLSEYRQKSTEHIAEIADLKIKLKTAIAERDSLLRDYPSEQDTSSDGATQSTESYKALRAEIILANRTLKGTKQAHLASLHYYVGLLDGFVHYIKYSMSQSEIEPIEGYPPSCRSDTLVEEGNQLHPATGISRILTYPARGSFAHIRRKFLSLLTWKRDIMLDSRREEVTEWFGKHMIYELRERESIGDEALEEEIACFRAKVGLDHTGRIVGGPDRDRIGVVTKPSRSDGKALPATWAKMDQLCKGATGSPSSLPDYGYIISTQHGSWPEVLLAINSWSFYKIHDSTFDESFESQELLADLYRIWWHCGGALCGRRVWLDEAEEKNYTRNEPIALDPFPTPSLKKRRVILGYPVRESNRKIAALYR